MGCKLHLSWFAVLVFSSFYRGVSCVCPLEKMDIAGGTYSLSKGQEKGSVLIYQCPENQYPYPDVARQCLGSGRWKPPRERAPKCKVVECPQPKLENGYFMPSKDTYLWSDVTTYECYSGYTMRGSSTRVCTSSGKWSGSTPICGSSTEEYCPNPGIPAGATRSGNSFGIDDKVTYRCEGRLFMIGSPERTCLESHHWSGAEPKCYFQHSYDTPLEIAKAFGSSISETLNVLDDGSKGKEGKKIGLDAQGLLNIYIAMDVSLSLDKKDIIDAKNAIKLLITKIASFEVTPKYHILFFASEVKTLVNIGDSNAKIDILQKLDTIEDGDLMESHGTDLSLAFKSIGEQINMLEAQAIQNNDRKSFEDVKHVIIMFTDGQVNTGGDPVSQVNIIKEKVYMGKKKERDPHLDIYIFGVGNILFPTNIKDLVTMKPNEQHYFTVKGGLTGLSETFDQIIDADQLLNLCGVYNRSEAASNRLYPWAVNVHFTKLDKSHYCIGSLVASKFVLTAAHCFRFEDKPEDIQIDIGPNRGLKVQKFELHKKYNIKAKRPKINEFYDFDVAIIELKDEVRYSMSVRSICIPCTEETTRALGKQLHLTCKDQEKLIFPKDSEEVHFLTHDESTFQEKTAYALRGNLRDNCISVATRTKGVETDQPKEVVTENFLCTGGSDQRVEHIACKGDSGGAVFKEYEFRMIQVGIVSWGTKDLCFGQSDRMQKSSGDSRDFHINLFKIIPFLKEHLGSEMTFLNE